MSESTPEHPDTPDDASLANEERTNDTSATDGKDSADPETPADAFASESTEPSASRRSGLFGMSRWLTVSIIAFITAAALAIATVAVVTGVESYNEARAAALSAYEESQLSYQDTVEEFKSEIASAERELLTTSERQLTDASIMSALEASVKASKQTLSKDGARNELDTDDSSNDELETEADELDRAKREVETSTKLVVKATDALVSDKQAKRVAEEEARKAAELAAKKAAAQGVGYEDLFRAGNSVAGTYYRFEGKIIQDAGSGTYRVNMTRTPGYSIVFWEDTILVLIVGDPSQRLLEDDIISFVGVSTGIQSYQTIFGATVELPSVLAEGPDVAVTGRDS